MISLQKEQEYLLYKYFSPLYPLHRKRISTKQRLICFFSGRLNNISLSQQTLIIAFAFVITICSFFVLTKNKYNEQNRAYYEYFDVIRPTSTIPISSEISFEWSIINDSSYFIVELLDESLILLWRSPKILETSVKLPNEVFSKLRQDNSYYWFVTVVLKDGEKIESNVAEFKISNIK
jgi:hypothetical protein